MNSYYNKYLESNKIEEEKNEFSLKENVKDEVETLVNNAQKIIDDFKKAHNMSYEEVINFSQSSKEIDEVINTNIKKGESEEMAIKKELDNKEVAAEEVENTPVNFEAKGEKEMKEEKTPEEKAEEKVEEEAKEDSFAVDNKDNKEDNDDNDNNDDKDDSEDDSDDDDKVEEAAKVCESCGKEMQKCECKKENAKKEECEKEEKVEEAFDMSKADRKTFEARIATLENNLKAVKAELKTAEPFKALYEEATKKIAELESYKEDVELDRLKVEKEKYAATCNFEALEDEDKTAVQEKIDDYKVSVYDFKAFMADVLKRYSRKQVYSNMEKIISYFSMNDDEKKADEIDLPSDKNQADRILDKYSDIL